MQVPRRCSKPNSRPSRSTPRKRENYRAVFKIASKSARLKSQVFEVRGATQGIEGSVSSAIEMEAEQPQSWASPGEPIGAPIHEEGGRSPLYDRSPTELLELDLIGRAWVDP